MRSTWLAETMSLELMRPKKYMHARKSENDRNFDRRCSAFSHHAGYHHTAEVVFSFTSSSSFSASAAAAENAAELGAGVGEFSCLRGTLGV